MLKRLLIASLTVAAILAAPAALSASTGGARGAFFPYAVTGATALYVPSDLQTAYDIAPLTSRGVDGTGQTIAIIAVDRLVLSDLQAFDAKFNLPDPTVQTYYAGGHNFYLPDTGETALDVEWAHALAPGATIQVYYIHDGTGPSSWTELANTISTATSNGAKIISMSWGTCRPTAGYTATEQALAAAESHGVSVFVASGDSGSLPGPKKYCGSNPGVTYPASDPSVVAVGGTTLSTDDSGTILLETAWKLSGGGKGVPLLRPAWQVTPNLKPGKYRYAPDVAFVGNPKTGVPMIYGGRWHQVGGTSLGGPAWAAIWALVRQDAQQSGKTAGAAPPLIYRIANSSSYSQAFHDITTGSNGKYHAQVGWDPVTGWGTPDVANLASAVVAQS